VVFIVSDWISQVYMAAAEGTTGTIGISNKSKVVQKLNSRMLHVLDVTRKVMWLISSLRKPKMNSQD